MKVAAKLRTIVTDRDLSYEGSITLGRKLCKESGLLDGEKVQVFNVNTGEPPFETYVIAGDKKLMDDVADLLPRLWCAECTYQEDCMVKPGQHCKAQLEYATQILDLCEEGCCLNGGAARLVQIGDVVEVVSYEEER